MASLQRLNLNLLYTLYWILECPTLTDAARTMALSQPAVSMALRRLRDHFADEIVIHGNQRQLTALGEALKPRVRRLLREADDMFNLALNFEPATAHRTITLTAPEAVELMFLSRVVPRLMHEAPLISIELRPLIYGAVQPSFDQGTDVAIVPALMADPTLCSIPLFDVSLTGLVWQHFPGDRDSLTLDEYLAGRHAALSGEIEQTVFGEWLLQDALAKRSIAVRTSRYSMLPHLVIGNNLIVTTSNWLAQHYASILPVRLVDLPFDLKPSMLVIQWQPHRANEPVIRWIVERLTAAVDWYPINHQSD